MTVSLVVATSFAFGAGMLATVNPCGFALLPAFFAYSLGGEGGSAYPSSRGLVPRVGRGFVVGLAVSVGFAAVFTLAGLLVAAGLRSLVAALPWMAIAVGAGLVVLGVLFLTGRRLPLRLGIGSHGGQRAAGYRGLAAFGAAYAVASLSCTLPVLLALVAQAAATSSPLQLLAVFAAYGAGAAAVLVSLSVAAALASEGVGRTIRGIQPVAARLGGIVLLLSGAYLMLYWLPALTGSAGTSRVGSLVNALSAALTGWLDANRAGVVGAAAVLATMGLAAVLRSRRRRGRVGEAQPADRLGSVSPSGGKQ